MLNAYATTGLENYAIGSMKTFQLQASKNGLPWDLSGGFGSVLLVDPTGALTNLLATIQNSNAFTNWQVQGPAGEWVYSWNVTDATGFQKVSLPQAFGVIDVTRPAAAYPPQQPYTVTIEGIVPSTRTPRGNKRFTSVVLTSTSPVQILAANANRIDATFYNSGTADAFLGGPGLTPPGGILLPAVSQASDNSSLDLWLAYVNAGTANLTIEETF